MKVKTTTCYKKKIIFQGCLGVWYYLLHLMDLLTQFFWNLYSRSCVTSTIYLPFSTTQRQDICDKRFHAFASHSFTFSLFIFPLHSMSLSSTCTLLKSHCLLFSKDQKNLFHFVIQETIFRNTYNLYSIKFNSIFKEFYVYVYINLYWDEVKSCVSKSSKAMAGRFLLSFEKSICSSIKIEEINEPETNMALFSRIKWYRSR